MDTSYQADKLKAVLLDAETKDNLVWFKCDFSWIFHRLPFVNEKSQKGKNQRHGE